MGSLLNNTHFHCRDIIRSQDSRLFWGGSSSLNILQCQGTRRVSFFHRNIFRVPYIHLCAHNMFDLLGSSILHLECTYRSILSHHKDNTNHLQGCNFFFLYSICLHNHSSSTQHKRHFGWHSWMLVHHSKAFHQERILRDILFILHHSTSGWRQVGTQSQVLGNIQHLCLHNNTREVLQDSRQCSIRNRMECQLWGAGWMFPKNHNNLSPGNILWGRGGAHR